VITRLTFFLDLSAEDHPVAVEFWRGVTGYELSAARGERDEFATLMPPAGDDHLRVQRIADGRSGTHLDVHVTELAAAVEHAVGAGAVLLARQEHAVLRSPGGYLFCLVTEPATRPSAPITWPGGHRSRVDQLCLDVGPSAYDDECAFWERLTGWPVRVTPRVEFARLQVPAALRSRVLLQRLEQDEGPVRGHLDVATDDREAEVRRLVALGAEPLHDGPIWTALKPPVGPVLCVTGRDPVTGRVG
jgi:hypothetical protein